MAINQPYVAPSGVSGNFWVTENVYVSPDYSHSRLTMQLFTNQAAYVSGALPIYEQDFLLVGQQNQITQKAVAHIDENAMVGQAVPPFTSASFVSGY